LGFNIPPDRIEVLRDRKADRVDSANGRLKALRGLFDFAVKDSTIPLKRNPAKAVPYLKSKKKGGFHTWSIEEVAMYLERHDAGTKARSALGFDPAVRPAAHRCRDVRQATLAGTPVYSREFVVFTRR
jgi:hypothetical protein